MAYGGVRVCLDDALQVVIKRLKQLIIVLHRVHCILKAELACQGRFNLRLCNMLNCVDETVPIPGFKGGITLDGADAVKTELQLTMVASEEQV